MPSKPCIGITMEMIIKREKRLNFLDLAYAEAIEKAGGKALFLPSLSSPNNIKEIVSRIDGLLLTGGADIHPIYYGEEIKFPLTLSPDQRTDFDLSLFKAALASGKPILAICYGMQLINVGLGGSLFQDLSSQVPNSLVHWEKENKPARHVVRLQTDSRLAEFLKGRLEFEVPSAHHQAIKDLGKGLKEVAHSPDGLIEGIEILAHPKVSGCSGIQRKI